MQAVSGAPVSGNGEGGATRRRVIVGKPGVNVSNGASASLEGYSASVPTPRGKCPEFVVSDAGERILRHAINDNLEVVIIRAGSGEAVYGVPCLYSSYASGFGLCPTQGFVGNECITGPHRRLGRRIEIFQGDKVISSSDYTPPEVPKVCGKTRDGIAEVCECEARVGAELLSADAIRRRNLAVGHFLTVIDRSKEESPRCRVSEALSVRSTEAISILEKRGERALASFLRAVLVIGPKMILKNAINRLGKEKNFPRKTSDGDYYLEDAITYANGFLRAVCVPSRKTKENDVTFKDHGAVSQIEAVQGEDGETCCRAFLPDLKEGDISCRDELFAWHSRVRDEILPNLSSLNDRLLVDALLFQYYGVRFSDLDIMYRGNNILTIIAAANKRLNSVGFRVIVNNDIAVLAKVGKAATLLADSTDAKAHAGRFFFYVDSAEGARKLYDTHINDKLTPLRVRNLKRSNVETFNGSIRDFIAEMEALGNDQDRIDALVSRTHGRVEVVDDVSQVLDIHGIALDMLADRITRFDIGDYTEYFHGRLLISALTGRYHGVPRDLVEKLPFVFRKGSDRDLGVVIHKVNGLLTESGLEVYERGGPHLRTCKEKAKDSWH